MIKKVLVFLSLSLATFMMVLDYSIANISIPYIAGDLATSVDQGTYVITSFAVGNAIGLAMTGWLTKRIGDVRLITYSILLFTFFSWTCGFSFSLGMLVVNRFIQGLVAGPIIPLSQALLIKVGEVKNRNRDITIWATIVIIAPVVGPILGGYISYWYSWPWIFYINIPVGIFCGFVLWFFLWKESSPIEKVPTDILGICLLALFVTCLQIFLDKGQTWDWFNSIRIRILCIGAIVAFIYLLIQEIWRKNAFLNLRLFSIPSFTLSIVSIMISYAIYFGTIVIVPLWLQEYMGYDALSAGLAVSPLGIAPVFLAFSTPFLMKKIGGVATLTISFVIFGAACFYTSLFTTYVDMAHIALSRFFFGFGFSYYITPLLAICIQDLPPEEIPNGVGIFHFVRAMVGAVGTSLFTTLFERRTIFHHERIGEEITKFNPFAPIEKTQQGLAGLNQLLDQQSSMLAINEAFYLMGWAFAGLVLLLILWRLRQGKANKVHTEILIGGE